MNLDNMISCYMLKLSKKYDLSLVEIRKPGKIGKKKIISKTIMFNYKPKGASPIMNTKELFHNKKELVSWLVCLK